MENNERIESMETLKKKNIDLGEDVVTKVEALCAQDLYNDYIHTEEFAKLATRLYAVKLSQIENGATYIINNTPYAKWKYVDDAIDMMKEFWIVMHDHHIMRYLMEDVKHLKNMALFDTFNNVSIAAGINWFPNEWKN